MLASTIRFSNHYQTPPTPTLHQQHGHDLGRSVRLKPPHHNHHTLKKVWIVVGPVIPGPNNVLVLAHHTTPVDTEHTVTTLVG